MPALALSHREFRVEIMDRPGLDEREHHRALAALGRINLASRACRQLWCEIRRFARRHQLRELRVLDVASGGGDIALGLWRLAARQGVRLDILGLDISPTACCYAERRCRVAQGQVWFRELDVVNQPLPSGFHVAVSSLFLHHLSPPEATGVLRKMAGSAPLVLISDLRRSWRGYWLAQAVCRTVTRSPVVRYDGPQSVRNAYSPREMVALCRAAALDGAEVRPAWPFRMQVRYEHR